MIVIVPRIGTAKSIPAIPQIHPQKIKNKITIRGLKFRVRPINLGSSILPIANWIPITKTANQSTLHGESNCIRAIVIGKTDAMNDPKFGIKLNTKIINAQMIAKSNPKILNTIKLKIAVIRLTRNLVFKYVCVCVVILSKTLMTFFDLSPENALSILEYKLVLPANKYTTNIITNIVFHKNEKNDPIPESNDCVIEKS